MKLIVGNEEIKVNNRNEFEGKLSGLKSNVEVTVSGHGEASLLVKLNDKSSFLVYFRFNGDHGFHSIDLTRDKEQTEEFTISNGQSDEYPLHWLRTRKEGVDALKYYYETGRMTPDIDWISESKSTI